MDRNIYLLEKDEIKLIQDINSRKFSLPKPLMVMRQNFTLRNVKDFDSSLPVDLVIVKNNGEGYDEVKNSLEEEIDVIRGIIDDELEQRENERLQPRDGKETPYESEEWPRLGNYDDRDNPEPIFTDWDDDLNDGCSVYGDAPYNDWFFSRNRELPSIVDNRPFIPDGRLSNYDLLQLDARIGQLKWKLIRLGGTNSTSVSKWSGSLLGLYRVIYEQKSFRVKTRTIYLMLDSIEAWAQNKNVPRSYVLAEVYVHEMMHAYYDNIKTKNLVNAYLQGITELEEPFAEFGMLCFLNEFDPKIVQSALVDVKDKLVSGDRNLQFYGLGSILYDLWYTRGLFRFSAPALSTYQKIMPAPRLSMSLVRQYRRAAHSSAFNPNLCTKMIHDIVYANDRNIVNKSKHYSFDGHSFGYTNRMVYAVLNYYSKYTNNGLAAMEADFHNRDSKFGLYHIFERDTNINNFNVEKYDMKSMVKLSDGSVICPSRVWESTPHGNTVAFLNHVKWMYRKGLIDKSINTLR